MICPTEGKAVAPCDGVVCRLFPSKHAVGPETADGVEILIHIGMDIISLKGKKNRKRPRTYFSTSTSWVLAIRASEFFL